MDPPWVTHSAQDHSQWTEDSQRPPWLGALPATREVDSTSRTQGWEASRMEATADAHSKLLINIFTSTRAAPDGKLGLEIPVFCRGAGKNQVTPLFCLLGKVYIKRDSESI